MIRRTSPLRGVANMLEMVDFGSVHPRDEIEHIRGITFNHTVEDRHYLHGNRSGREVRVVQRFGGPLTVRRDRLQRRKSWLVLETAAHHTVPHLVLFPLLQDELARQLETHLQHGKLYRVPHPPALLLVAPAHYHEATQLLPLLANSGFTLFELQQGFFRAALPCPPTSQEVVAKIDHFLSVVDHIDTNW